VTYHCGVRVAAIIGALLASGCQVLFPLDPRADAPPAADAPAGPDSELVDAGSIDAAPITCPSSYTLINGSHYRASATATTQTGANTECELDAAGVTGRTHLVVFRDETEKEGLIVSAFIDQAMPSWIGLADADGDRTFEWITGEPIAPPYPAANNQVPWEADEPNDAGGNEDCVVVSPIGLFSDVACGELRRYVCECDAFAAGGD
jgi:hypothetical protein